MGGAGVGGAGVWVGGEWVGGKGRGHGEGTAHKKLVLICCLLLHLVSFCVHTNHLQEYIPNAHLHQLLVEYSPTDSKLLVGTCSVSWRGRQDSDMSGVGSNRSSWHLPVSVMMVGDVCSGIISLSTLMKL